MSVPFLEREFRLFRNHSRRRNYLFRVGGPIDRFEVYAGNYYQRGDIIAEIDSRGISVSVRECSTGYL